MGTCVAAPAVMMRTSLAIAIAVAVVVGSGLGCAVITPTQAPPTTTTSAGDEVRAPLAPASAAVAEGPPAPAPRCRLSVTDTQGCEPSQVERLVEPVRHRLEACRGAKGGKLSIRVRESAPGKLGFDVEPGSSLDPIERQCVLDALNTIQIDPNSMAWMGPSVPPSGFTSLLTIEW